MEGTTMFQTKDEQREAALWHDVQRIRTGQVTLLKAQRLFTTEEYRLLTRYVEDAISFVEMAMVKGWIFGR
jgi:hypothetical protein